MVRQQDNPSRQRRGVPEQGEDIQSEEMKMLANMVEQHEEKQTENNSVSKIDIMKEELWPKVKTIQSWFKGRFQD